MRTVVERRGDEAEEEDEILGGGHAGCIGEKQVGTGSGEKDP